MTKKAAKFEKPEAGYSEIEAEDLQALKDLALDEYAELVKVADEDISDEQLDRIEELKAEITAMKTEETARVEAEEARAQRIADAKAGLEDEDDEEDDDAEGDDDAEEEADDDAEEGDEEDAPADKKAEPILASGRKRSTTVARTKSRSLRSRKAREDEDEAPKGRELSILSNGEIKGFSMGEELSTMDRLVEAFTTRLRAMPGGGKARVGSTINAYGVARMLRSPDPRYAEFSIDNTTSQTEGWNRLMQASRLSNVQGADSAEALVAAGGWCLPSTNYLDLLQYETTTGGLDVPEITVVGGINFTRGPDFEDIFDDTGFLQTEANAIAGVEKTFLEVACTDWEEIRLDAIGFGVKAPILTASPAGFPALVRRYLEGALVAHWHKVNAYVINKVIAGLGSVQNFAELGSATSDLLNAVEIAVWSLRYKFRMSESQTFEAMFPMWVKGALRADLSRRTGVDFLNVTDSQINAWFTSRGIRPQFVFDWSGQDLTGTQLQYPQQVQFGIWPAGSFVKGTNDVISLDAIYDSTEIKTNTYTAAFFEEAILVARTGGQGRLFSVGLDLYGRTGAADIGAEYDADNS